MFRAHDPRSFTRSWNPLRNSDPFPDVSKRKNTRAQRSINGNTKTFKTVDFSKPSDLSHEDSDSGWQTQRRKRKNNRKNNPTKGGIGSLTQTTLLRESFESWKLDLNDDQDKSKKASKLSNNPFSALIDLDENIHQEPVRREKKQCGNSNQEPLNDFISWNNKAATLDSKASIKQFIQTFNEKHYKHYDNGIDLDLMLSLAPVATSPTYPEYSDSDQWPMASSPFDEYWYDP